MKSMAKRLSEEAEQGFLEVLTAHEQLINKVVRIYAVHSEDRRDLFQEIVYQLWRSYGSFKGDSRVSTWIYRVALNTAITSLRKGNRLPVTTVLDDKFESSFRSFESPERNEQVRQLYSAIRSLGDIDRALVMLYLEDTQLQGYRGGPRSDRRQCRCKVESNQNETSRIDRSGLNGGIEPTQTYLERIGHRLNYR